MARPILPLIDFRTTAEREGVTKRQQTVQAIANILKTVGAAEKVRRDRQILDKITRAISGGATNIEAIAAVASQGPEFGTGLPGILQRIGGAFEPPGGGMRQGIQQAIVGQAIAPRQRSKIQELIGEGYSPTEARLIRDISHGIKPRASVRQTYDNMTEVEKLDFLTKVKQRAEGQYYGVEGGNVQPREPQVLDWANSELEKLEIYKSQRGQTEATDALGDLGVGFGLPRIESTTEVPEEHRPPNLGTSKKYKYIAINPQTGQKVGSNDGIKWEPIQ